MKLSFEDTYPNIARWVDEHEGWIEIGYDADSPLNSFVRAIDCGGMRKARKGKLWKFG